MVLFPGGGRNRWNDRSHTLEAGAERPSQPWTLVLAVFTVTSIVEAMGISQVFAFMPLYLTGIVGPAIGALVVGAGPGAVLLLGGLLLEASSLLAIVWD